jgi:hypothetical protein
MRFNVRYGFDTRANRMALRFANAGHALDATYKIPEKQKILPIPKRTLKMIGTAKHKGVSNQHGKLSQGNGGMNPPAGHAGR